MDVNPCQPMASVMVFYDTDMHMTDYILDKDHSSYTRATLASTGMD